MYQGEKSYIILHIIILSIQLDKSLGLPVQSQVFHNDIIIKVQFFLLIL